MEKRNATVFNPDGDKLYIYPAYTDFEARTLPRKNECAPEFSHTRRNDARLEALDLEYKADCVYGSAPGDDAALAVESRLYVNQPVAKPAPESKRGNITCVSQKSSLRLKKLMARTLGLAVWIDLTFADDVIADRPFADRLAFSYSCLNQFQRVLRARGLHYIWKKEIESRKSGEFVGARVPHYHVVLSNLSEYQRNNWSKLCIELLTLWVKITGTNHPRALEVALKIKGGKPQSYRLIVDTKTAIKYIGKYFSKTSPVQGRAEGSDKESIGRVWGHSKGLPVASPEIVYLRPEESVKLRRFVRKYLRLPKTPGGFIRLREQLIAGFSTFAFLPGALVSRFVNDICNYDNSVDFGLCPF